MVGSDGAGRKERFEFGFEGLCRLLIAREERRFPSEELLPFLRLEIGEFGVCRKRQRRVRRAECRARRSDSGCGKGAGRWGQRREGEMQSKLVEGDGEELARYADRDEVGGRDSVREKLGDDPFRLFLDSRRCETRSVCASARWSSYVSVFVGPRSH